MAKQLNVNLAFTADTGAAKAQLMDLQRTLHSITMDPTSIGGGKLTAEILEASKAAGQLSVQLKNATNVDTGTLDFSKLNQSLQKSGQSLASYGEKLMKLGPEGQAAFAKITSAVAKSEVPFRRSNKLVNELFTTLKNTARWQLSSSILHGFMGALQSAYGYAQDLNESLNDIRIITGYTTDQMADFAGRANKAAKALSATTNEYVKASLIYYQQGLGDKAIEERTAITLKMANVTKQSAEVVSDQLTAIWNNFDDGTKSLESYADAITALGAATASSTDEIAEGLEKFAAIADTVGLSFEYATSALATVTAETRQSADVVGTAFKTLFARLQDLELGKTLDDGTSLGKYSAAMAAVGVNIKSASGELKSMDQILDELGGRWQALSKDQQVALAQTVAGTRQYAQLIALMDNWDKMQTNLKTVEQSEGTIDLQYERYAEGWEAASKRVRTALESVYEKLLDDDAFIGLLNSLENIIGKVDFFVERLGGMRGTLLALGALATQLFSKQLAAHVRELSLSLQTLTERGRKRLQNKKFEAMDDATAIVTKHATENETPEHQKQITNVYAKRTQLQKELIANAERFNDEEREALQLLLDQNDALGQQVLEKQKMAKKARQSLDTSSNDFTTTAAAAQIKKGGQFNRQAVLDQQTALKGVTEAAYSLRQALSGADLSSEGLHDALNKINNLDNQIFTDDDRLRVKKLVDEFDHLQAEGKDTKDVIVELNGYMAKVQQGVKDGAVDALGVTLDDVDAYTDSVEQVLVAEDDLRQSTDNFNKSTQSLSQDIQKGGAKIVDWGQMIITTANAVLSVSSAISTLQSAWETLSDPDTTAWERLSTVFTTLATVIPTLLMAWKSMSEILNKETLATMGSAIAKLFKAKASREAADASRVEAAASNDAAEAQAKETATDMIDGAVDTVQKGKGKGNQIFKGKNGQDRWFSGKYNKAGRPLDQNGQIIGQGNYSKAGLDSTGKLVKTAGKGAGKAAAKTAGGGGKFLSGVMGKGVATTAGGAAAAVGAIAAGIAIVAGTIALVVHQTQKWDKAAQEAEKRAVQAAEAYQSVADAYNEFSSNLDNYSNAKKGLSELTKGTKEYQQAIIEANESAMALIESHEGLAYTVNSDGLIEIDEEALKAAEQEKLDNMQKAQMNKQLMAIEAREKRIQADSVELQRKGLDSSQGTWTAIGNVAASTAAGAGAGALIGAGTGALIGGVGAAPGAIVGTIAGAITGLVSGIAAQAAIGSAAEREQAAIDKVTALDPTAFASKEAYEAAVEELRDEIGDNGLVDSLKENYDAMKELAADVRANKAATDALNKQMVAAEVQNNKVVQDGRHTEEVVAAAATFFEADEAAAMAKLEEDGWGTDGISKATKVNDQVEKVFADYAAAAGLEGAKVVNTTGTDKNRKFIYEIDGKEVEVTLDEMKKVVAKQKAAEAAGLKAEQLTDIFNRFSDAEAGAVNAVMSGDTSAFNLKQMQGKPLTAADLGLSAEDLKTMGYESAQAFNDAMAEAQEKAAKDWQDTLGDYSTTASGLMQAIGNSNSEALQNISQASVKAYGSMLEGIESAGGSAAAKAMGENLQKIMEQHGDKAEEIMNAAASIDWSQGAPALNELNGKLFDMGIYIDQNSDEWKEMTKAMEQINTSVVHRDLDKIRSDITSIKKLAGEVKLGSVISDEDYATLVKYNGALANMFALTADGYMYVGDGNLEEMANQAALDKLKKTREDNKKAMDAHAALNAWGWSDGNGKFTKEDWYGLANGTDDDYRMVSMTNALINSESEHLKSLGFDPKYLKELTETLNDPNADPEKKNKAREQLQKLYGEILALNANVENDAYSDTQAEEVYASTLSSIEELKKAYKDNTISKDTYDKYIKVMVNQEIQQAESLEELREAWATAVREGVDDNASVLASYNEQLEKLTIENINSAGSFKELEKAWKQAIADNINTDPEVLEAYNDQLEKLTIDNINGAGSFKELEKAWKKAIADNKHTDPEVIEAYDEALEKLTISNISGANSFKELEKAWNKAKADGLGKDEEVVEAYTEALTRLNAQSLENASSYEELDEAWKKAVADGVSKDESVIEAKATGLENIARNALGAAESLEEFDDAWDEAQKRKANVTTKDYTENLIRLGEACSTATEELEKYQEAVEKGGNTAAAEAMLRNAIKLGDTAEEFGVNAEELETLTRDLMDQSNLGFDAALTAATAYLKRAEEFGMTAQELRDTLSTLMLSFDELSTTEADELFKDIAAAAEEAGVSIGELVETMTDIGQRFGLTGESALEMATIFTEAASEYSISTEELAIQAQNIAKSYGLSVKAAAKLAVQNQRMNSGVSALVENWEEWKETLTTSDATSTEYAHALSELQTVVRDLVGAGDDFVMTSEFMEANMGLIERAASGDEQAINQLGVAAAGATLSMLQLDEALAESMEEAAKSEGVDSPFEHIKNDFLTNKTIVQNGVTELMNAVAAGTVNVGDAMTFLGDNWINALNEMALQTGMSVEEMNSLLGQMGVDADVTITDVPTKVKVPKYRTEETIISDGSDGGPRITETQTSIIGYSDMDGVIQVASINADSKVTYTGNGKVSSSSKSTGGGGKSAPERKEHRKADTRYKQQDDIIDDLDEKITDKEREIDKLTGEAKAQALEELEALRAQKKAAIDEKARMASDYTSEDKGAMESAYAALGLGGGLEIENGNVTNIESALLAGNDKYNQLVDAYNAARDAYAANDTAANQKVLEAAEQALNDYEGKLEEFEEAYQQYADSRELVEDLENESADLELEVNRERPKDLEFLDELEHRYANVTAEIEAAAKATERATQAADDLYGKGRAQAMERINSSIQTEIGLLTKKKTQAEAYLEVEKAAMLVAFQAANATQAFTFNADGSIANMEEVMSSLITQYNALVQTYNDTVTAFMASDGGITEAEQARLDEMQENIDQFKENMDKAQESADNYSNTLGVINDTTESIADKQREIQSNNYEILVETLNNELETTTAKTKEIDYYLNKIADDLYSMAEAAALTNDKFDVMSDVLEAQRDHADRLKEAYASGQITQANYVEGMKSVRDSIYSELQAIQDLDKEMLEYYGKTLTKATEELGKHTERMDHLNSVLDHYKSLLTTIGKENDHRMMGVLLQGVADNMENSLAVAKAEYEFYQSEADKKKALMDSVAKDSAAYELYKKEWEAAEKAARDSQDKMLASTAEWASSMKAVVENEMAGFAQSLEKSMTGGTSFDEMTTSIERVTSLQEEYLTATNQTYEVTKMMRIAQKALDETSNTAVKNKLKGFMQETAQMQNQEKLSKFELEMQQAKYDLLLAEIALEEAQNAKSTVRLQRNADGNFGYVYTADASQVADAQQSVDDAQNALYNKSLDAANDYTSKYQQTMNEMYDTMTSLQQQFLSGEIATQEEYDRKMLEAKEYYYQKLQNYSSLYQVAVSTDSSIIAEAWSTDFADMTTRTEEWMLKVDEYAANCGLSFRKWEGVVAEVEEVVGGDFNELALKIQTITDASDALTNTITGTNGVIDSLQSELDAVSAVTDEYGRQRQSILDLILAYEEYLKTLNNDINTEANADAPLLTDPDTTDSSSSSTTDTPTESDSASTEEEVEIPDNSDKALGVAADIWYNGSAAGWGGGTKRRNRFAEKGVTKATKYLEEMDREGKWYSAWKDRLSELSQFHYNAFETGGYTGSWGPEGKFAMLHQKELVLNAHDTENILAAVDMVRNILQTIDMHSMSAQLGGILSTPGFHNGDANALEQNVKIEASFPNVQDHNEIEEAFNNLINKASQYAYRR